MKHWIGRHVVIQRTDHAMTTVEGVLKGWDTVQEKVILAPGDLAIPFRSIHRIRQADSSAALHSIGYIISHNIQFDNAIYFGSSVMIWKGNRLVAGHAILTAHDEQTVTLSDGRRLLKDEHIFVVRSLRGQTK
ncbi:MULTISPECIES: hypothetical protein [Paenibacillus]|uniref:Uncharacterized protein n=1 Tax=Paenibacillus campinasensis TaxID=66347 RepID=A0A268F3Y7_9BACL|nr:MULTISPECIES: hypothetical protein [Paenibacillus]MUG64702.1 hypothetical protein [Paenibacillus campinasensis]PAD80098.1 hypothetical protein CHH67_01595 [Paenibacillus campinasensis]PAK55423.1 hypothetical protein CHH75_04045 [Paenibacillus sp. 7541]